MTTEVQTVQSLEALASEINAEHKQCLEALQKGLEHALSIGEKLIEAKSQVAHGEWGVWLATNVTKLSAAASEPKAVIIPDIPEELGTAGPQ